jgi:hypothetical protein
LATSPQKKTVRLADGVTLQLIARMHRLKELLQFNWVFVTFRGSDCQGCAFRAEEGMRKKIKLSLGPGIDVEEIDLRDGRWVLSARAAGERSCPVCGDVSTSRHHWHHRRLQDLPFQGTRLVLGLRLGRWRCLNEQCSRKTFVGSQNLSKIVL